MNHPGDDPPDELDELLAPLRAVEPIRAIREANRHAALKSGPVTPWWQRSIAVPVPVAVALAASLLLAIGARYFSPGVAGNRFGAPPAVVAPAADPTGSTLIAQSTTKMPSSVLDSASYVAGVGFVERVHRYEPMESP